MFPEMHKILPDGIESGRFKILHNSLTETQVKVEQMKHRLDGHPWLSRGLQPNYPYCILLEREINKLSDSEFLENRNARIWMSDTPMEQRTNTEFVEKAHGDVLIAGLGMGMVLHAILNKKEVSSVTVLELELDLIKLIEPYVKHPKLKIIHADAYEWCKTPKKIKFNCVWLDIWPFICVDYYFEMVELEKSYRKLMVSKQKDPNRFIGSWSKELVEGDAKKMLKRRREYKNLFGTEKLPFYALTKKD